MTQIHTNITENAMLHSLLVKYSPTQIIIFKCMLFFQLFGEYQSFDDIPLAVNLTGDLKLPPPYIPVISENAGFYRN